MDTSSAKVLRNVLTPDELETIPTNIVSKVDTWFERNLEELMTVKAVCESSHKNSDETRNQYESKINDMTLQIADYNAKMDQCQQNVAELRSQLDSATAEILAAQTKAKEHDTEIAEMRYERNKAIDERDTQMKMVERRNVEVERLQRELQTCEKQLQSSVAAKCEAIMKYDEVQSKEVALELKEKRLEQERIILNNQIQSLHDDLNRTVAELQTIRRDNSVRILSLETSLSEKTEEVKIANSTIASLHETNESLTTKAQELAEKLLAHKNETNKMMDYYQKELNAKNKLADLYKQSSDDYMSQVNELTNGIQELKKLLNDASEQYGDLETRMKEMEQQHQAEIDEHEKLIQSLRDEVKHANELLKVAQDENIDNAIEKMAPSAAAASRLFKSGKSFTEVYSLYVKATEELALANKEKNKLELQMKSILQELEEHAPIINKQQLEYQKIAQTNEELTNQLDQLMSQRVESRELIDDTMAKLNHLDRENKKLEITKRDLARQICFLLKEVEQLRGGYIGDHADQSINSDMSANEVISKKYVTFSDIAELQENNQKLLLVVRDLSSKLEEMEEVQSSMDQATYEAKIKNYSKRLQDMQISLDQQTQMMNVCMQQRDRYKKLYTDAVKNLGKSLTTNLDNSSVGIHDTSDSMMDEDGIPSISNSSLSNEVAGKDKKINDLEQKVQEITEKLKQVKEEYDEYRKEKMINDKMTNEQFDKMRNELRELTSSNCKLLGQVEYTKEQISIQQKNVTLYKKQISSLEERNKNYDTTISKHEYQISLLRDELMKSQQKCSQAEVEAESVKHECRILRESEARWQMEKEALHRERQNQQLLLNNIEMIKTSFERAESEGKQRLETRLDESIRECSAIRRRLQEEQDNFRDLSNHLKQQTDTAVQRMNEEVTTSNKLREELCKCRDEIMVKTNQINELSKKLEESLTPSKNDNPIMQANKKAREMELKYEECRLELESIQKELESTREHSQQYYTMSTNAERELKEHHDNFVTYKSNMEEELAKTKSSELLLKSKVEELQTELSLQITSAQLTSGDATSQLHRTQTELKEALQRISDNNRELRDLRAQCNSLTTDIQSVEQKYANEIMSHSDDIRVMSVLKEELNRVKDQLSSFSTSREEAIKTLTDSKKEWENTEKMMRSEQEELEARLKDLDAQNSNLHDQIQALTTKLSCLSSSMTETSMNESASQSADTSMMNRSFTDDNAQSLQLLQTMKYLRKEKDIAVAKVDILKAEGIRLRSEVNILQKKLEEVSTALTTERNKSDSSVMTASKHEDILRKLETFNAITDSNRSLREERDTLTHRVKELSARVTVVEDELFPMQEKNRELSARVEQMTVENTTLRTEAMNWRQRANRLAERSHKNPEDFKRIQTERENLAKMLSAEKELVKKANDELDSMKLEKAKWETDIVNFNKQIQTMNEEKKKLQDELNTLKQTNSRLNQEVMNLKNSMLQLDDDIKKANDEIKKAKDDVNTNQARLDQTRRLAVRYKTLYVDAKTQLENLGTTGEASGGDSSDAGSSKPKTDADKLNDDKVNELNSQLMTLQEECEQVRKENEQFKEREKSNEQNKVLLAEARVRIQHELESNKQLSHDLEMAKNQIQNLEQTHDTKLQLEQRISRIEQDKLDQEKESAEQIKRLTRENENLQLRIQHLQRQLGMQQGTKPATSSGTIDKSPTDPATRTANVKPMATPSTIVNPSATVNPWRGNDTPLASIRPMSMQSTRTAAVMPTSQSSVPGSSNSSSASVTALVPPQQQVHTTGNSPSEAMSSSPTSSHTDYMPATSSAAVVVVAIPPLGSSSAESSQEAESTPANMSDNTSSTSQIISITTGTSSQQQQQQAVAMVSPRIEGALQNPIPSQQSVQAMDPMQAPSTSATASTNVAVTLSGHQQASSSTTVTTSQTRHKRQREMEGESTSTSTSVDEPTDTKQPQNKRSRIQLGEAFQGVSESGIEIEYQVPTSSQRDQEDDVVVVDSEDDEDDDDMADEGTTEADDGQFDDVDNNDIYEVEQELVNYDDGEGPDIDDDNIASDNNEVEVDDSNDAIQPNQSENMAPDASHRTFEHNIEASGGSQDIDRQHQQQIQTISSGSNEAGASTSTNWRMSHPRQSIQNTQSSMKWGSGYDDTVDESVVPSTPTLFNPNRSDGCQVVSSPHPQVPQHPRFTFGDSANRSGIQTTEGMGDNRVEGLHYDDATGRNVPSTPREHSPPDESSTKQTESSQLTQSEQIDDAVAGPSRISDSEVPNILIDNSDKSGPTSDNVQDDRESNIEDEIGTDGVSSEGEKQIGTEEIEMEDDREAEASTTPSITTRSRGYGGMRSAPPNRRGGRGAPQNRNSPLNRPTPITWNASEQQNRRQQQQLPPQPTVGGYHGGMMEQVPNQSPNRNPPNYPPRGQRGRRMRRASGPNYNMRY